jgi:hypothetical protein
MISFQISQLPSLVKHLPENSSVFGQQRISINILPKKEKRYYAYSYEREDLIPIPPKE